ncbi:hypothetical protein BD779DRAFT_1805363 [Infundibulicybe gibba]|nr:hypothetical protein BD779DRAFT_1805363 [Infundibulicybe gibba]
MNIQINPPTDINPPHDQASRGTELIDCVKAFGTNLLRDTHERELEPKNLLDRLDTLDGPTHTARVTPQIPTVVNSAINAAQEVIKGTYLLALLRLPPVYFVRVCRVIHDAELDDEDVDETLARSDDAWETETATNQTYGRQTKLAAFKSSWESFAGSLIKEWKTFNVVSVLLLSSVVAILQLQTDPSSACRISALLSLLFGLMSLLYGCLYIVWFGTMKKMYSTARYVQNAKQTNNSAFCNAWVLIAMELEGDPSPGTNPTTPVSPTSTQDRVNQRRYVLYITHLPNGKPWGNIAPTPRAQAPEWLENYCLEEDIKCVKPLSGITTDSYTRR